jgi:hypothetical protein
MANLNISVAYAQRLNLAFLFIYNSLLSALQFHAGNAKATTAPDAPYCASTARASEVNTHRERLVVGVAEPKLPMLTPTPHVKFPLVRHCQRVFRPDRNAADAFPFQ